MTPEQHAAYIRQLMFQLEKAEHGLAMPYSAEDVAHYRRLLEQARKDAELQMILSEFEP